MATSCLTADTSPPRAAPCRALSSCEDYEPQLTFSLTMQETVLTIKGLPFKVSAIQLNDKSSLMCVMNEQEGIVLYTSLDLPEV